MISHNQSQMNNQLAARSVVDKLYNSVAKYRPALFDLLEQRGDETVIRYAKSLFENAAGMQPPLAHAIARRTERLFGENVAAGVHAQLLENGTIGTADHHGICTHPIIFQGDLVALCGVAKAQLPYLVVLATGNVPLNNASYPRGLIIGDKRYPLFPDNTKHSLVYGTHAFSPSRLNQLPQSFTDLIASIEHLHEFDLFSDQVSLINNALFRSCMPETMPQVIVLQLEDVISELLADGAQADLLLNPDYLEMVIELFNSTPGAWSEDGGGSHLIWGCDQGGCAYRFRHADSKLVGAQFALDLSSGQLAEKLAERSILPGLLLSFAVLLENSASCLGGFNQVDYLTRMKMRLCHLAGSVGQHYLAERLDAAITTCFSTGLVLMLESSGRVASIDSFIERPKESNERLESALNSLSLRSSALVGLREMYTAFVPLEDRDVEVCEISLSRLVDELKEG